MHFNIICVTKKKFVDVTPCWCNIYQHKKKLTQIFEDFFGIYMIPDVPVVLQQVLKYCCQMLFMIQTTKFDNISMLQKRCATFYWWWKFSKNAKKHAVLQQDLKNRFFWIKCVPDVLQSKFIYKLAKKVFVVSNI